MEHVEPAAELYDFIYRDHARFGSYYAQLFDGKLSTIERTSSERRQKDLSGKVAIPLVSSESKSATDIQQTLKEVIDPHDVVALDVLTRLQNAEWLNNDPTTASPGSVVLLKGSVVFIDRGMIEMSQYLFEATAEAEKNKPKKHRHEQTISALKSISHLLEKLTIPSTFCFKSENGKLFVGVIHESGMSEPISSYYFKHGSHGIPDVFLVGIKETKTVDTQIPQADLISSVRNMADALGRLLFPESAIRVTPIAIFRKLGLSRDPQKPKAP